MIVDIVSSFLMFSGAVFSFIAALGILRMPDLFLRMQAAAKTGTLGVGCTILAVATYFGDLAVTTRAGLVILFLFLTAPVAAHMIARAGYIAGVSLWKKTTIDELVDQYDPLSHYLRSHGQQEGKKRMEQKDEGQMI